MTGMEQTRLILLPAAFAAAMSGLLCGSAIAVEQASIQERIRGCCNKHYVALCVSRLAPKLLPLDPGGISELRQSAQDKDPKVSAVALSLLAEALDPAWEILLEFADSEDKQVRKAAADGFLFLIKSGVEMPEEALSRLEVAAASPWLPLAELAEKSGGMYLHLAHMTRDGKKKIAAARLADRLFRSDEGRRKMENGYRKIILSTSRTSEASRAAYVRLKEMEEAGKAKSVNLSSRPDFPLPPKVRPEDPAFEDADYAPEFESCVTEGYRIAEDPYLMDRVWVACRNTWAR